MMMMVMLLLLLLLMMMINLTASGLSPSGSGYYAYT
jgi:hypothetical protein